jgi:A/G-specific adenine glycosylase
VKDGTSEGVFPKGGTSFPHFAAVARLVAEALHLPFFWYDAPHMMRARKKESRPMIATFRRSVLRWFASNGRDLPWRRTRDPWSVLVSEMMLQQTQVGRVMPKYEAFMRRWPTPAALAHARLGDVLTAWSGLGYNRRARHLHEAAAVIARDCEGKVPDGIDALEALPGVGRYTARAVASFAFNADVTPCDTNVRRIVLRYFFGGEFAARPPSSDETEEVLTSLLPRGRSRDWHGALMDFGSAICHGRRPACVSCPLSRTCAAAKYFFSRDRPHRALVRPQSRFEGSRRQARGAVLRALAQAGKKGSARRTIAGSQAREDVADIIDRLIREKLIVRRGQRLFLP